VIALRVVRARPEAHAASPTVAFTLQVEEPTGRAVHAALLHVQVRVEPARRRHLTEEQAAMVDVFGEPSQWSRTLRPLLLADVSRVVPAFQGKCDVELPVLCTYDLEVAATKYVQALRDGAVPLSFLFRGTVFFAGETGLTVEMVPWDREASFDLPVATWRAAMDAFFPEQGWVRLRRDVLDSLLAFKAARAHATWDEVMRDLLETRARGAS
jgi:hypothetical protein